MSDALTRAMNAPSGRLAEILIARVPTSAKDGMPSDVIQTRLDLLMNADGTFGKLARIRLGADLSILFHHIPNWTRERLVPLFDWSSPDAADLWSAREYSNYIGSPELVKLIKKPLLELFSRPDVSEEEKRTFAEWLAALAIANQKHNVGYPVTPPEVRTALRKAGSRVLWSVAHQFADEMGRATPEQKLTAWRTIVGPVFQAIWPLDLELQTPSNTFKLVHILRNSGEAFPEAADVIISFIRPEDPHAHTSVFSISETEEQYYAKWPEKILDLLVAVVGDAPAGSPYALKKALERLATHSPKMTANKRFQKLEVIAGTI